MILTKGASKLRGGFGFVATVAARPSSRERIATVYSTSEAGYTHGGCSVRPSGSPRTFPLLLFWHLSRTHKFLLTFWAVSYNRPPSFMMTWVKANEIKKALQDNEDYVAVVYDVKTGYELQFVYGVPGARICVLQCVNPDKVLIMPRDEFDQLHKTEGDVIAKATDNNQ